MAKKLAEWLKNQREMEDYDYVTEEEALKKIKEITKDSKSATSTIDKGAIDTYLGDILEPSLEANNKFKDEFEREIEQIDSEEDFAYVEKRFRSEGTKLHRQTRAGIGQKLAYEKKVEARRTKGLELTAERIKTFAPYRSKEELIRFLERQYELDRADAERKVAEADLD